MPRPEQLPDDLKELAYRNAVELSHIRWKTDVEVLLQALRPYMDAPQAQVPVLDRPAHIDHPATEAISRSGPSSGSQTVGTQIAGSHSLDRISKELAVYIGPISDLIVRQAAKRCSSIEELCTKGAKEIEDEASRAKFLRACRS